MYSPASPTINPGLTDRERDAGWAQFTAMSDGFKGYEQKTTRVIPVVRLTPA